MEVEAAGWRGESVGRRSKALAGTALSRDERSDEDGDDDGTTPPTTT
jgi:hypothetical protein